MAREICLFDKFSFCKNGDNCRRHHLQEVCLIRGCDYRKCDKRHPNPCKTFMLKGFCRFGTACKYSHRISKETEEQNKKIESLEEITKKLTKQVADQNDEIEVLRRELLETESRELDKLQKQIDSLIKSNNEKEKAIMSVDDEHPMELEVTEDEVHVSLEEAVVTEERCEAEEIKKATIDHAQECLIHIEALEIEITNIKKNTPDLGTLLMTKCKQYCDRLDKIEVDEEICEAVLEKVYDLREYLRYADRKPEKDRNLKVIRSCKKYLRGYLKYPKRPHQIPLNSFCKSCLQKL